MRVNGSSDSCSGNAQVDLSEPRDREVTWAPVTGVAVSGAGLALLAAALLYACHRKLLISAPVSRLCAYVYVYAHIQYCVEELGENMLLQIMIMA
jgi:hypothetical protein